MTQCIRGLITVFINTNFLKNIPFSLEVVYSLIWFDISLPERVAEKEKVH